MIIRNYSFDEISRYVSCLVLSGLLVVLPNIGNAAWISASPPGEQVLDFALVPGLPTTLFATTQLNPNTSIWKSIDPVTLWTPQPPMNSLYHGVGIKPDDEDLVLAGNVGGQLDRSTDGGTLWTNIPTSASHDTWQIAFVPAVPMTAYAAGFSNGPPVTGGIQQSIDAGLTWTLPLPIDGDADPAIVSLAVAPTDADTVYASAIVDPGNDGLYKTTDGGTSWTYLSNLALTQVDGLAVDPTDADVVYAGAFGSGLIRRSVDGGASWQILHDPFSGGVAFFTSVLGIAINPSDRRIIYAIGGSGVTKVIVSTDCGNSWANVDSIGIGGGQPSKAVIDSVNNFIYVLETVTIYREALLTTGSGSCSDTTGLPSGGGSGSVDYLLLALLFMLGLVKYQREPGTSA